MLDVRRLVLLAAVIDSGSMTAAAQTLSYTTSAVSQQLSRLEKEVGQPLLQRQPRGIVPTEAGLVLADHARRVARQLAAAEADLAQVAGLRRGRLTVGTFPTVGGSLLALAVSQFRSAHPGVRLTVRSARLDRLTEMLDAGEADMSLLWDYAWNRVDPGSYALTHLLDDPTMLVVSADHPLADRERVDMTDLAAEEWVVREPDHPVAEVLDRSCRAAGFRPRIAFHANDYQEAQAMVSVGLGIALAPRTAVTNPHPDVRVISLGSTAPARRILLARRQERVPAPAEAAMVRVFTDVARTYQRS
ncbi:LysR family transcriptional regulator [Geodermatophilus sp. YIM 151500]|uniref:LysR family transcriptional regulator n=1 Tax=Geodermatophilus sp. YIM 151500 TaxID=2984531 RepID=UPI0021E42FD1|nr:LysR family transcriptional regulator [Geodermatophilus sp. YIM 151500]MCV2489036.1 LysR family transcriptional regulator [Geodermatophilus sp. YIM 151500]